MEADFTRFYATDLRAAAWGAEPWGVRRLWAHIRGLPPDSALSRKLTPWRQDHELLATAVDALHRIEADYVIAHGGSVDAPVPFPRPDADGATAAASEPTTVSTLDFAALLMGEPHG